MTRPPFLADYDRPTVSFGCRPMFLNFNAATIYVMATIVAWTMAAPARGQVFNWTQLSSAGDTPSIRCDHAMAYDSARGVTLLFGGNTGGGSYNDTWEWDGTTWIQRSSTGPSRLGPAMAYDNLRDRIVMFGGSTSNTNHQNETWEWNGNDFTWTNVSPLQPEDSPPARTYHAMAYDSARGVTVLFGGYNGGGDLGDTWEWNGNAYTWTNVTPLLPENSPSARSYPAMAYDSGRGVTVLFGGSTNNDETWEWDGATWTLRSPLTQPQGRYAAAMAYDSARGVSVLFGSTSEGVNNETWEWDGTNWLLRAATSSPSPRHRLPMAYDSARGVLVLFGGFTNWLNGETWEGDPGMAPPITPIPTMSQWGLIVMTLLLLTAATVVFGRRRAAATRCSTRHIRQ